MPISKKQKRIMAFSYTNYDALICDGAIRSGKTAFMMLSYVDWAMRCFNGQRFAICGKTVDSATKNIIAPYMLLTYAKRKYQIKWRRQDKLLIVRRGSIENTFEVFGGKDESSFMLIQGRTLAGVLLDEVALMPRSFVEQALARCSVEGSKFWFSCNPAGPEHWFYKEWVLQLKKHNAIRLQFQLEDNPSLSQHIIDRYKSMYSGVFYRRYILGLWCIAEGLVYDFFDRNVHVTSEIPEKGEYYISIDYGTMNPFSAGLWSVNGDKAIRINEYYYNGRKKAVQRTDEEYCDAVEKLAESRPRVFDEETGEDITPKIRKVVVDPSAASFIAALRKRGFTVVQAKNDVLDGIRRTAVYLKAGNIMIGSACGDAIEEFGLYCWDDKEKGEDKVVKDHDHAMDDIRYFCSTVMKHKVGKDKYESIFAA